MKKFLFYGTIFIIISFLQNKFLGTFKIETEIISNIITFLSIIFGFYITSLAIFATSRYVSNLYEITDENDTSKTLLNTLIDKYKFGLCFILVFIIYLLIVQFFINQSLESYLYLSAKISIPFMFFCIVTFIYSYYMVSKLINIIIQEAKIKNSNF